MKTIAQLRKEWKLVEIFEAGMKDTDEVRLDYEQKIWRDARPTDQKRQTGQFKIGYVAYKRSKEEQAP